MCSHGCGLPSSCPHGRAGTSFMFPSNPNHSVISKMLFHHGHGVCSTVPLEPLGACGVPWGDCVPWGAPGPWGWQWGDRGVSLGPGAGCGVAVGAVVAWPWLCLCCSGEGSPCIVLSSKVKKPAKKQPSELSRKPNQKEKRGRAEEKPRNKSASPRLPASPFLLGMGLFLHGSSPSTPGWDGAGGAAAPAEELGWFLLLLSSRGWRSCWGFPGLRFCGVSFLVGHFLSAFPGSWAQGGGVLGAPGSAIPHLAQW